jgi:hypothetical protein
VTKENSMHKVTEILTKLKDAESAFFDRPSIVCIESRLTDPERKMLRLEIATLMGNAVELLDPPEDGAVCDATGRPLRCDSPNSVLAE